VGVLLIALVGAAQPAADHGKASFYAAMAMRAGGNLEGTVERLLAMADAHPADPFADDALAAAAELLHRRLHRPDAARAVYLRLEREHPLSRHARRAQLARESLEAFGAGAGGAAQTALAALLRIQGAAELSDSDRETALAKHLEAHPSFVGASQVRLMLAEVRRRLGQLDAAAEALGPVVADGSAGDAATRAHRILGDLALDRGDTAGARASFTRLLESPEPATRRGAEELLARVETAELTSLLGAVALGFLVLVALALVGLGRLWRRPAAVLWPPPVEVRFLLPVLLAVALLAGAQPGASRLLGILAIIGGGTLCFLWLAAAWLERAAAPRGARWGFPFIAALVVIGLCFVAIRGHGLTGVVAHTLADGPER
jgi:hypothetical protein